MKLKVRVHVISAFLPVCDMTENLERHADLHAVLKQWDERSGIRFGECTGRYGEEFEMGYVVVGLNDEEALAVANAFRQESVLVVDEQRMSRLIYTDKRPNLELGVLVASNTKPVDCDYTYSAVTDAYYYTRGVPHEAAAAAMEEAA